MEFWQYLIWLVLYEHLFSPTTEGQISWINYQQVLFFVKINYLVPISLITQLQYLYILQSQTYFYLLKLINLF